MERLRINDVEDFNILESSGEVIRYYSLPSLV